MSTPTITPIETQYNGYRFRSRLEARWAVFFDTFGLPYEYEHEGFDVQGRWYLPDFYFPTLHCYGEVKPQQFSYEEFVLAVRCRCLLLDGMPMQKFYACPSEWVGHLPLQLDTEEKAFRYYQSGKDFGRVEIVASMWKQRLWFSYGESIDTYDCSLLNSAVAAARAARFEKGATV